MYRVLGMLLGVESVVLGPRWGWMLGLNSGLVLS